MVVHRLSVGSFVDERHLLWEELGRLVVDARREPERLGPDRVRRLGELYRAAAADLALARRAYPGDPVVERLEALVGRARHLVYDAPSRRGSLASFIKRDYWRLVASRPLPLLIAAICLFAPAFLAGTWALRDEGAAAGLVPSEYQAVTEPRPGGSDLGLASDEKASLSSQIFTNNIRVGLFAFAGGIALGVGAAALLIYNGILLGAVSGLAIGSGNGRIFFELVTMHGVLELSCIVVAGAAGLRFGWAFVEPGRRTRRDALAAEARQSVQIVLGTVPWLVVAGLVEGFLTPSGLGLPTVLAVGLGLGALYWGLVLVLGRVRAAPSPSPAGRP